MSTIRTYEWINDNDCTRIESDGISLTDAFKKLSDKEKYIATTGLTRITANGVTM